MVKPAGAQPVFYPPVNHRGVPLGWHDVVRSQDEAPGREEGGDSDLIAVDFSERGRNRPAQGHMTLIIVKGEFQTLNDQNPTGSQERPDFLVKLPSI